MLESYGGQEGDSKTIVEVWKGITEELPRRT